MSIKVYVSGCSGNKEIKKKQEFICRLLDLKSIKFEEVDITLAGNEEEKDFMRKNARPAGNQKTPLPPQIFLGDDYIGDYEEFHESVECETMYEFLRMAPPKIESEASMTLKNADEPPLEPETPEYEEETAPPEEE